MTTNIAGCLANFAAFKELDAGSLENIARHCVAKNYTPSQIVLSHGESSTDVYFVVSGALRATMYTPLGREISYQELGSGEMFGELAAIDNLPRSTHVIALVESKIISITGASFVDLMSAYPAVAQATLKKMAGVVRFLCDRIYEFGALDVNRRIRAELVRIATLPNNEKGSGETNKDDRIIKIEHLPKHQELANRLATHREAVTRELRVLEKAGIIEKHKHSLVINDIAKLRSMIWD